jgi:hypothetical protein
MSDINERAGESDGQEEQPTPPGWKQTTLADILTPPQMAKVQQYMKAHKSDPEALLNALKAYFMTIHTDLNAKGIDPNYLAYVLYGKAIGII